MQTIKTKSGEIVLVDWSKMECTACAEQGVPHCAHPDYCEQWNTEDLQFIRDSEKDGSSIWTLAESDYPKITEQQAAELVEKEILVDSEDYGDYFYKNYNGDVTFISALDSLRSLIESYKLNPDKVVIIKKG